MENLQIIRIVENYSLIKKGDYYYIDNGFDDVSEYFDVLEAESYLDIDDAKFIQFCSELFNY